MLVLRTAVNVNEPRYFWKIWKNQRAKKTSGIVIGLVNDGQCCELRNGELQMASDSYPLPSAGPFIFSLPHLPVPV
jgi:hypothetical protein